MSGQMSQLLPIDEIAKITEAFFTEDLVVHLWQKHHVLVAGGVGRTELFLSPGRATSAW